MKGDDVMAKKLSPWCKRAKISMIRKDISVQELAEEIGCTRSYLSAALNGLTKNQAIRRRVSDYLNISDSDEDEEE